MQHSVNPTVPPVVPVNALGQPSPGRTDFKGWTREGLEQFARQVADENLVLRANNDALHIAWREVCAELAKIQQT